MILRPLFDTEIDDFDKAAHHPLQSWAWGDFKKEENVEVERVAYFEGRKLQRPIQVFFHKVPHTSFTMGYYPKGYMPDEEQLAALRQLGEKHRAIAIKMEPNIAQPIDRISAHKAIADFLLANDCKVGRSLFTKHTFILDLTPPEEKLFENLKNKTRYNVNLALKKGVQIRENTSKEGIETYVTILEETTRRQEFYAHTPAYFRRMWDTLGASGVMRIFEAVYEGQVLVSWIMFVYGETLYYPYGSSRNIHRDVMASNLMMWEMIRYGKSIGMKKFDMWGSLGPNPDKAHPWFGFHRFKEGYGGQLYEFLGTYDLVLNPPIYSIYTAIDFLRWKVLRAKARIRRLLGK